MHNNIDRKYELEDYIFNWHHDANSYEFAAQLGKFLFIFMDHLQQSNVSDRVYNAHERNLWSIGYLISQYGEQKKFSPEIFRGPPFYEIEYKRLFKDSASAIQSYDATCARLSKYAIMQLYKTVEAFDFELFEDISDLIIGLRLLEKESKENQKGIMLDLEKDLEIIRESYVVNLGDVDSREAFFERMNSCLDTFATVIAKLDEMILAENYFLPKLRDSLKQDTKKIMDLMISSMMNI